MVDSVARQAGLTVEWLADRYGLPFSVVHDFDYPGHSARRAWPWPAQLGSGIELIDRLRHAVEAAEIPLITNATVSALYAGADRVVSGVGKKSRGLMGRQDFRSAAWR